MLPVKVGWQIELTGPTGDADPAADTHQPVIFGQALPRLAAECVQIREAVIQLGDGGVERLFGNGRIAAISIELLLVLLQIFQYVGFHVGAGGHVHDLENGLDREMMIQRVRAVHQLCQASEELLQTQVGSNAFVERVFVQDHSVLRVSELELH